MQQADVHTVLPLFALAVSLVLIFAVCLHMRNSKTRTLLLIYLISMSIWSISYFLLNTSYAAQYSSTLERAVPLLGLWVVVAFLHLVCLVTRKHIVAWLVFGYVTLATMISLASQGYISQRAAIAGEVQTGAYADPGSYLFAFTVILFAILSIGFLFRGYSTSSDANSRNESLYLLMGALAVALASTRIIVPTLPGQPAELVVFTGNAMLVSYVLHRRDLPDFKATAKQLFTYVTTSLLIAPLYIIAFWAMQRMAGGWANTLSIAILCCMIFVFPLLFITLRKPVEQLIEWIIFRERSTYRHKLLSFAKKMTSVLSIDELGEGMLEALPRALNTGQVSLLLPVNGGYISRFYNQLIGYNRPAKIEINKDSPIVNWLVKNNKPLPKRLIDVEPEFKNLSCKEKNAIQSTEIALLVPMSSGRGLVGILALSEKRSNTPYSIDEIDLLINFTSESAVALENAQLYIATKEKVYTDELTGLLNHGHFHQRIDEEISRCCRFGSVFSVLFLDIDLFKSYNDTFGHLAGDEILRQAAQCIKSSIRVIDVAFRYGGDEFAVMLPESSLEDALHVGERIRKRIQGEMDSKGVALTCSIGIAAWPTDGISREGVIQAADKALYWSKQKGRNQVSLASEMNSKSGEAIDINGEHEILSTIQALAATVDAKDTYTFGHSKKASEYAVYIAKVLGLPNDKVAGLRASALLHDIGKIRVSDKILSKPGPLSDDEWAVMRDHPKFGVAILKPVKGLGICLPTIQHHHERFDGDGYPAGLAGSDIPIDARILAVADAYDAMTSDRPYRRSKMSHHEAIAELNRCAGTQFDPEIIQAFDSLWEPLDSQVTAGGISRLTKRASKINVDIIKELKESIELGSET